MDKYSPMAEFYDHVVPYQTRQDVAFFVEAAKASGGTILELGCGTGRVLIPTARAGAEIVGLDLSPAMLSKCQAKLSREKLEVQARVQLVAADMREFYLKRGFSLVTIPFRPFQHLVTVEDQLTCLSSIHQHLVEDGKLILDLFNPDPAFLSDDKAFIEHGTEPEFTMPDGSRVLRRQRIVSRDLHNQVQDCELIYYVHYPDGREERKVHRFYMRYLFKYEAEHLLARSGFDIEQVFADYDGSPYGSKYPGELIFVAKKK